MTFQKGYKQTEEHTKKISFALKGRNFEMLHSKEEAEKRKEKCRLRMLNNNPSIESRNKMSLVKRGKTPKNIKLFMEAGEKSRFQKGQKNWTYHSEETKQKISDLQKGKTYEERMGLEKAMELKEKKRIQMKINNPMKGKHLSEKNKQKLKIARAKTILPKKDTKIEVKIQNYLKLLHIKFITHNYMSEITHSYQCDILIPQQEMFPQKTIIEVDGCYWHACPLCNKKITERQKGQIEKDKIRTIELTEMGFNVIRLREHDIKKMNINHFENKLKEVN